MNATVLLVTPSAMKNAHFKFFDKIFKIRNIILKSEPTEIAYASAFCSVSNIIF